MNSSLSTKGTTISNSSDNFYWCVKGGNALTVWIALLDDVTSANGGIQYYNESTKLGVVKHEPSYAKGSSQKVSNLEKYNNFKKVCPRLRAGRRFVSS